MSATFAAAWVLLYVAHLLADYPFQTDHQAQHKADPGAEGWSANLSHAFVHVFFSGVLLVAGQALLDLPIGPWSIIGALTWVGVSHSIIDRRRGVLAWMRIARQEKFAEHGGTHHVDQTAHITALALAAFVLAVV